MDITKIAQAIVALGGRVYLVGGAVRDELLGKKPKDMDYLVTGVTQEALQDLLGRFGKVDYVGQSFGVFKLNSGGVITDFAMPRKEVSTGSGHKDFVVLANSQITVEEDLFRRDFTINAIAKDVLTGAFIDPYGGIHDCRDKVLRLVNPNAFEDDPLRMLRAVQFQARFGLTINPDTFVAMKASAYLIKTISPERISGELCKLMTATNPSTGFRLMHDAGLLAFVLPELAILIDVPQPKEFHAFDVFGHLMTAVNMVPAKGVDKVWLRWAAVLHDIGKLISISFSDMPEAEVDALLLHPSYLALKDATGEEFHKLYTSLSFDALDRIHQWRVRGSVGIPHFYQHEDPSAWIAREIMKRLKLSSVADYYLPTDRIEKVVQEHMFGCSCDSSAKSKRKLMTRIGKDDLIPLLRLRIADRLGKGMPVDTQEWHTLAWQLWGMMGEAAFSPKDLAINGNDIMTALNLKPGKQVGVIVKTLFDAVVENPDLNNRETLLDMAKNFSI